MSPWRSRWLVIGPVVLFVLGSLMLSCGGGGGGGSCTGSYDAYGNYIPGSCSSSQRVIGYNLLSITIASGPAASQTPTPSPTKSPTKTPTPTPVPQATSTAVEVGTEAIFHAVGTFVKSGSPTQIVDITNSRDMLWTSKNNPPGGTNVLLPPTVGNGGIYNAISVGCACVDASAGGTVALPVGVTVYSNATATPSCGLCPTPLPTPTATPGVVPGVKTSAAQGSSVLAGNGSAGLLEWMFDAQVPLAGALAPAPDGRLYFLTADGMLHALDASGRERWRRVSGGVATAVSDNGTVFALGQGAALYALSPRGKPLWSTQLSSSRGPLAASGDTVFIQADGELDAVTAPGLIQWQIPAESELTTATVTEGGGIVTGSAGGAAIAIAPDGTVQWSFKPDGGLAGAIALAGNRVYLGSQSGTVYALDAASGNEVWHFDTTAPTTSGPAVGPSGFVFFGSDALYAIRPDGTAAWHKQLADGAQASLVADGVGGLFVPALDKVSALLNADGSVRWTTRSFGQVEHAALSSSGVLFVATADGHVYAIR